MKNKINWLCRVEWFHPHSQTSMEHYFLIRGEGKIEGLMPVLEKELEIERQFIQDIEFINLDELKEIWPPK